MLGHQRGLEPLDQPPQASEVIAVQPVNRSQREPDSVDGHRIVTPDRFELPPRGPTAEVIFGVDLPPIDRGAGRDDLGDVRGAQAEADAPRENGSGHAFFGWRLPFTILSQDPFGVYTQASPWLSRLDVPAHDELVV